MIDPEGLKAHLCRAFCTDVTVEAVPAGLAISGRFLDQSGDPITAYVVRDRGAPFLADRGDFLGELEARGVPVTEGTRSEFLERVLAPARAFVDPDTLEIRTPPLDQEPNADVILEFLVALVRAYDVGFWSRERVRSTFFDDVADAVSRELGDRADVRRDTAPSRNLSEFPADIMLFPRKKGKRLAVFLASSTSRVDEALLLWLAAKEQNDLELKVAAVIESAEAVPLSGRKVLRALNRIDAILNWRDDESAAITRLQKIAELPAPIAA
jgi:hypothetical protein